MACDKNPQSYVTIRYFLDFYVFIQHCFICRPSYSTLSADAGTEPSARNYRPGFRENKPKKLVLYDWKRAFWACFRKNWVYKFGHRTVATLALAVRRSNHSLTPASHHLQSITLMEITENLCQKLNNKISQYCSKVERLHKNSSIKKSQWYFSLWAGNNVRLICSHVE